MISARGLPRTLRAMDALAWLMGAVDGFLATVMTPVSVRRRRKRVRFVRRWQHWVGRMIDDTPAGPVHSRPGRWLVGLTRGQIVSVLGPPPATSAQPHPNGPAPYWHAETWYYPPEAGRPAIAITFEQGIARSLDPLSGPG